MKVIVTKAELFRILDSSSISFANFMAGGSPEANAIKFIWDSVDDFDLNDSLVNNVIIPVLVNNGAISNADIQILDNYVQTALGQ